VDTSEDEEEDWRMVEDDKKGKKKVITGVVGSADPYPF
jgi:hypothetical protein